MRNIVVVFGNRNHTMQFATTLRRMGIRCKTINTPRALSEACGISVVLFEKDLQVARTIIQRSALSSFRGIFLEVGDLFKKFVRI